MPFEKVASEEVFRESKGD